MKKSLAKFFALVVILSMIAAPVSAKSGIVESPSKVVGTAGAAPVIEAPGASGPEVYIVQLAGDPVATYQGGVPGYAATSPLATGAVKLDSKSKTSQAYAAYLAGEQAKFVDKLGSALGRSLDVRFQYQHAYNGVAVVLTPAEARVAAGIQGVTLVQRDVVHELLTDVGPTWIGAPYIWDGYPANPAGTMGEGVVVGIIDSGINHDHPSFAAVGGDGYAHVNPFGSGNYVGWCATDPTFCNDKLIGAWNFVTPPTSPEDRDDESPGHGSHTASTVAGNVTNDVVFVAPTETYTITRISGVAPHANIIAYKACEPSCPGFATSAAVNQAVIDGVDVLNYSISGGESPYTDPTSVAFMNANAAGVFASASAGNNGPGAGTVAHEEPWNLTVAASTHNRAFPNSVIDMSGGDTAAPADIAGIGATSGYGPAPIVYAGDFGGNNLCAPSTWAPGTFSGQIVVCDRGTFGRVEKGQSVLDAGGGGYVLANDIANGNGLTTDGHVLPATHITYADGVVLKTWLASGTGHMATISGGYPTLDTAFADKMASFSSRGPTGLMNDMIKPDISAPGVDILAATATLPSPLPSEYVLMSGTSMSSPHAAGAAALMRAAHPNWSPTEIKSALMTTGITTLVKEDGVTPADPFDIGNGRVNLSDAVNAGLVMDITNAEYVAANPGISGDMRTLNLPSMADTACVLNCGWTRVVSSTLAVTTTWVATVSAPAGMGLTVTPDTFTLPPYGSQALTIAADVSAMPVDAWAFAQITLQETSLAYEPEIALTKSDGLTMARPGDTLVYTLEYATLNPAPADNAVLTETVPANTSFNAAASTAGWTEVVTGTGVYVFALGTVPGNITGTVDFAVDIDPAAAAGTVIANTAYFGEDYLPAAVMADDVTTVEVPVLTLTKDDGGVTVNPGDTIVYTLSYGNSGSYPSTGVMLTEFLPANTTFNAAASSAGWVLSGADYVYTIGSLAAGASGTVNFAVDVDAGLTEATTIQNMAHLEDDYLAAPVMATDDTPVEIIIPGVPSLSLAKTSTVTEALPGDVVVYELAYANTSPDTNDTGVVITETLPEHTAFDSAGSSAGWTEASTGVYVYTVGPLAFGASGTANFAVMVHEGIPETVTAITNTAQIGDDFANLETAQATTAIGQLPPPASPHLYLPLVTKAPAPAGAKVLPAPNGPVFGLAPDAHLTVGIVPKSPAPIIDVNPDSLSTTQPPNASPVLPFGVSNLGGSNLLWEVADVPPSSGWSDNFDSYAVGSQMHGQGGWKGWDNAPAAGALVTNTLSHSAANSVAIRDASDLVHEYSGYNSGYWIYRAWQYVPSTMTGSSDFIMLNTYNDGGPYQWSTQVSFDGGTNLVANLDGTETLPLVEDAWVEIVVEIDLVNDIQTVYYDGQLLFTDSWSRGNALNIAAVDLFANNASTVYYDDISLQAGSPPNCDYPQNVPWISSVVPITGTTAPGGTTAVDLTLDTTGLAYDTYTSTLCILSNDPVTPLVELPVTLVVSTTLWADNFDSYAPGSQMHGQGGWKGWGNDPGAGALVTTAQAHTPLNSVDITGASDLVHEYMGYNTGVYSYTIMQYVPSSMSGESYFILLNQYDDAGSSNNWSVQVVFNGTANTVTNTGVSGGTAALVEDQWVEIVIVINLNANTQTFYYNGTALYTGTWTEEVSGGGILNIGAVDLFANSATSVYYDTALLELAP